MLLAKEPITLSHHVATLFYYKKPLSVNIFFIKPMAIAILLAAGKSKRFGANKLTTDVLGKPLLYHALQTFHDHPHIREVCMVVSPEIKKNIAAMVKRYHFPRVKYIVLGGRERQESLAKGLAALHNKKSDDIIVVQNGANPLVTEKELTAVIKAAQVYGAAAVGKPVIDTIKETKNGHFSKTHPREKLIAMQTPQAAKFNLLKKALTKAQKHQKQFSDETTLLEFSGIRCKHVAASSTNFKITTREDLDHLKAILGDTPKNYLVGLGQDSHGFEKTKKGLTLGGVTFAKEPKLKADSDGDVILHALCNAIAQALGEKSLGTFATPLFKEKSVKNSKKYLDVILQKMKKKKYHLNNIGIMIEGRRPRFDAITSAIKKSLSKLTNLPAARIGITATTGEKLTAFGKGKGLQCFTIVSLRERTARARTGGSREPTK